MFALLALLLLSPLRADTCQEGVLSELVADVALAARGPGSTGLEPALDAFVHGDLSGARDIAHQTAEKARRQEADGDLSEGESADIQQAMGWIWNLAARLEQGWEALEQGDFAEAKEQAHAVAEALRAAEEEGRLSEEQLQELLPPTWRLWNLADGLEGVTERIADREYAEAREEAHQVAEQARGWGEQERITEAGRDAVVSQAGELYSEATTAEQQQGPVDVPYFSQYENDINDSGSCQNTSVAMVLNHYGVEVTPDEISERFGTRYAQSPNNLATVFNTYAAEAGISQRLRAHTAGTLEDFDGLLDAGEPVIVHGYFTGYGHVVVATGRDDDGYTVNDPAGVWSETFKGGYAGSYNGDGVHYNTDPFVGAVATYDGSTITTMWYHEVVEED